MKKLIFSLIVLTVTIFTVTGQNVKLAVGMKAPDWVLTDADGKEFSMNSWSGKVLQINYVDPDVSDLNDPLNDAIKHAREVEDRIKSDLFKGFGIVDTKSTWKPNALIRTIAGNKAKKFNTTILFDYKGKLQEMWGMPEDNYTVVIVDKNRVCRALYKGEVPKSKYEEIIQLIIDLGNE
ncbi:MAG: redoxin domain-containing protein [Prolixibacteraceae bacterium]|nr:redoxin domain-containing protein [Prolixibacteraceae bacterium]